MANPRHGKEQSLYPTRRAVLIILGLGVIIGILIVIFLVMPTFDTATIGHVAPHIKPNTGRIIAKVPTVKAKALTAAQLHVHHLRHLRHLAYLHVEHVKHLLHITHVRYLAKHALA
jgi:hypothetical protein